MDFFDCFQRTSTRFASVGMTIMLLLTSTTIVGAQEIDDSVSVGKVYKTEDSGNYNFSETDNFEIANESNTYGKFSINGHIADITAVDDVPMYEVESGNLVFTYNYGDELLNAPLDEQHVVKDDAKSIDSIELDEKIGKGAIVVQVSNDRLNWVTEYVDCNAFEDTEVQTVPIYTSKEMQLINGCYYRFVIAFKTAVRTEESNFLFFNTDKYEYQDTVEVYEFYAVNKEKSAISDNTERYSLGSKQKVSGDGYTSPVSIEKEDLHYGWDLGEFFVSGYTDEVNKEKITFLKNAGDEVTLWFRLDQDINCLNGDEKMRISDDSNGYDEHFETPRTDFGRGTLIVRYTDHNNVKSEPQIYTDYLVANASVGADTRVQLFEEGDYEVTLDYQITRDELFDKVEHYQISFEFAVRNGNCMVFPFDISTGSELSNSTLTENGFRLDLAKSRYLNVNIQREVLAESGDKLVEDVRFNGPARDGETYTEEGIYTIVVSNEYSGQMTTKKIYVGSNPLLKAYITTGLSLSDINELVKDGATIDELGNINLNTTYEEAMNDSEIEDVITPVPESSSSPIAEEGESTENSSNIWPLVAIVGVALCVGIITFTVYKKRHNKVADTCEINVSSNDIGLQNIESERKGEQDEMDR